MTPPAGGLNISRVCLLTLKMGGTHTRNILWLWIARGPGAPALGTEGTVPIAIPSLAAEAIYPSRPAVCLVRDPAWIQDQGGQSCLLAKNNMQSALQHPAVIEEYPAEEVRLGRLLPLPWGTSVHVSRFGVIPKGHTPGKWRMITDLTSPHGCSVNDAIDPGLCSMEYITVDCVARRAWQMGPGALLAKADIKSAYRIVPVHPDDLPLLGVEWKGTRYIDRMLPFGLRSAPKIFNALADALQWLCQQAGVEDLFHYLDDFAIVGPLSHLSVLATCTYSSENVRLWEGSQWCGKIVCCRCDNQAVVQVIASRYSRERDLMHLLRCLFFFEAHYDFSVVAEHVPGVDNVLADDLSRNRLDTYLLQVPNASKSPVPLPPDLLDLLLDTRAQCISPNWTKRFCSIVGRE